MSSHNRVAVAACVSALLFSSATACTPGGPSPVPVPISSKAEVSPVSGPTATTTARDGRTVLPTSDSKACSLLSEESIRDALGEVGATLGQPQPNSTRLPDGTIQDFCIYPFDKGGATTNALVVEVRNYPSPQAAVDSDPFALIKDAESLPGLRLPAKYAVNTLNDSTEFVVVSVEGARVVRLLAALPPATAWDRETGREHLRKLAATAGL